MQITARFFGATLGVIVCGCGGTVEVADTHGGAAGSGGASSSSSSAGGGGGTTATSSTSGTTDTTDTPSTTSTFDDGCPDLPDDVFWVDVQVGTEKVHLSSACPYYNEPYGPDAYAMTNGKSGPEWYFVISACEAVIPEGEGNAASLQILAAIPENAVVSTPYATTGTVIYTTDGQGTLDPATSPSIVFDTLGPEHSLVTGKLTGFVTWIDGQTVAIDGQFSVCRRGNIIYI